MTNTDFTRLRGILEAKLKTIASGSDRRDGIIIQHAPDALDQTQFATERDLVVSLLSRESRLVRRVRAALRRMEGGIYGICLACEEPISVNRIEAVPWAELCLRCQERADRTAM